MADGDSVEHEAAEGGWNYFNYFTEIEEYFWKKRGAHLLVSPLDWAAIRGHVCVYLTRRLCF